MNWIAMLASLCIIVVPSACVSNKQMTVGSTAMLLEDISKSANKQSDLRVIREGMPAYLMLIDGMVEAVPNNARLLITAAQVYASFASAFIEDADKDYARVLFAKAKDYGLQALEIRGLKDPVTSAFSEFEAAVSRLDKDDVPYMFWTGTCWGSWIRLNLGSIAAVAELPRVEALMKRVLVLDEQFYYGGPHLFMGILFASRPQIAGGDLNKAHYHFKKALAFSQDAFLMTRVYFASHYARKTLDRELFSASLQKVLDTPVDTVAQLTLLNTVAHHKAQELLAQADDFF
ncbi:MAG: TRAP transporter TatT component family protein [Desulfobacterales bacterium]